MILTYESKGRLQAARESDARVTISEETSAGRTRITVTAVEDVILKEARIDRIRAIDKDCPVIANGFQSWTETREFARGEHLNDLSLLPPLFEDRFHFREYGSYAFWTPPADQDRSPKGLPRRKWKNPLMPASDDLTAFEWAHFKEDRPFFIGSFNGANAWLIIQILRDEGCVTLYGDVEGKALRAGESFTVFDFLIAEDPGKYFESFSPRSGRKLFGYTSWYNHYQNINARLIEDAIDRADERLELFQIDDGFETFVGDWLDVDPAKFPQGLEPVVEKIHAKGMLAGIWLAPFVAEDASRLSKEHPDWIARDADGKKIYAGCNWSGDCPLDLNVPEAVEYVRKVLRSYRDMGFDLFKLDFIYAASLKPLDGKTRAETSEFAYGLLREELQDRLIIGCGAALANCIGRFDYCRIGPDVSLRFDDSFYMRAFHPERISTKVTLVNTIYRSPSDGRMYLNDPDVFLLRDDNIGLSREQRKALTLMNALFGSLLMTSDDTGSYDEERRDLLDRALAIFRRGKALSYERRGDLIVIDYELDGGRHSMTYDMNRGILTEEI